MKKFFLWSFLIGLAWIIAGTLSGAWLVSVLDPSIYKEAIIVGGLFDWIAGLICGVSLAGLAHLQKMQR